MLERSQSMKCRLKNILFRVAMSVSSPADRPRGVGGSVKKHAGSPTIASLRGSLARMSFRRSSTRGEKSPRGHRRSMMNYQLSADMSATAQSLLERRYGGLPARRAAKTIQRAWRAHCLARNFAALRSGARKRLPAAPSGSDDAFAALLNKLHALEATQSASGNTQAGRERRSLWREECVVTHEPSDEAADSGEWPSPPPSLAPASAMLDDSLSSEDCVSQGSTPQSSRLDLPSIACDSILEGGDDSVLVTNGHEPGESSTLTREDVGMKQYGLEDEAGSSEEDENPPTPPARPACLGLQPPESASCGCESCARLHPEAHPVATYAGTQVRLRRKASSLKSPPSPIWKRQSELGGDTTDSPADHQRRPHPLGDHRNRESCNSCNSPLRSVASTSSCDSRVGSCDSISLPNGSLRGDSGSDASSACSTRPGSLFMTKAQRKKLYRVGLNLFNNKPEEGLRYLMEQGFVEASPAAAAKFILQRRGLAKQRVGELLGSLHSPFAMDTLNCFVEHLDLGGLEVDEALRTYQSHFRMPGEAQKIERLMEVFAQRYASCNGSRGAPYNDSDTVFLLAYAVVMLNTDLHSPAVRPQRRMKLEDFVKNLRGISAGQDLSPDLLAGIYDRIKTDEFRPSADHVSQVMRIEQKVVGNKPVLSLPHRRLVCYCRAYQVSDINKRDKSGAHQREIFLFNDMMLVTKVASKKKHAVTYAYRESIPLAGLQVRLLETQHHRNVIRFVSSLDNRVLLTLNARNENDRVNFVADLRDAILESNEQERIRIGRELSRQTIPHSHSQGDCPAAAEAQDTPPAHDRRSAPENALKDDPRPGHTPEDRSAWRTSESSLDSGIVTLSSNGSSCHEDQLPPHAVRSLQSVRPITDHVLVLNQPGVSPNTPSDKKRPTCLHYEGRRVPRGTFSSLERAVAKPVPPPCVPRDGSIV